MTTSRISRTFKRPARQAQISCARKSSPDKQTVRPDGGNNRPAQDRRPARRTESAVAQSRPARHPEERNTQSRTGRPPQPGGHSRPALRHSPEQPASDTVRLNKALADAGICSRRKADEFLEQGRVRVNGVPAVPGTRVRPRDSITLDGTLVRGQTERCYLVMNKPVQVVCTVRDPENRPTVIDILPERWRRFRLYPVGRLDYFSEGLIILTNDGDLTQLLAHPRHHQPKVYRVRVRETVTADMLELMRRGMRLAEGEQLAPVELTVVPYDGTGTVLEMTLHQGINRQIRRMCRDLGLTVLRLRRIAQGTLKLGDLSPGEVRELSAEEVADLYKKS